MSYLQILDAFRYNVADFSRTRSKNTEKKIHENSRRIIYFLIACYTNKLTLRKQQIMNKKRNRKIGFSIIEIDNVVLFEI